MKATTVRFSDDLWATISAEAELAGLSASQFIREAALARAAAAAGARGEVLFDSFPQEIERIMKRPPRSAQHDGQAELRSEAEALRAESRQARRTSERLRARVAEDSSKRSA